jgi:glyoxylase-like metal-dependent hydrolase (beta-lactamase superfamily II)
VAIVGDVLFRGSIGRTDFPYGDHAALIAAIRDKLLTLPDDTTVLCGHGPATTIGQERRGNPFLRGVA